MKKIITQSGTSHLKCSPNIFKSNQKMQDVTSTRSRQDANGPIKSIKFHQLGKNELLYTLCHKFNYNKDGNTMEL
jgi:hypothetical protein